MAAINNTVVARVLVPNTSSTFKDKIFGVGRGLRSLPGLSSIGMKLLVCMGMDEKLARGTLYSFDKGNSQKVNLKPAAYSRLA